MKRKPKPATKWRVNRTDKQIIDALESLPGRLDIVYSRGIPRSGAVPPLRDQICMFLDAEEIAGKARGKGRGE